MTGVVSNLTQLKRLVASGNDGMQQITAFNPLSLPGYSSTQVAQLASDRSGENLNLAKLAELSGRIAKTNEGLESLRDFMDGLSISNTVLEFDNIIQSEAFKNQKVEILDTRKTDIIINNTNALKATFTNAR